MLRTNPRTGNKLDYVANLDATAYVGLLVNPVDRKVCVAVYANHEKSHGLFGDHEAYLVDAVKDFSQAIVLGRAQLTYDEEVAVVSGCARVHCPDGVIEKGVGLGLMLYCAAALASARMAYEARKERHYRSAIVSPIDPQERSKAADSFWTAQVNRGIAKSRCYEYTGVAIAPPLCYNQIDTATVIRSPMCLDAPREVTTEAKAQVDRTPPVCSSDIDFSPRAVTSRTVPDPRVEKFVKSICKGKRSFRPIRFPQMAANPTAWEDIFGSLAIPTADPIE